MKCENNSAAFGIVIQAQVLRRQIRRRLRSIVNVAQDHCVTASGEWDLRLKRARCLPLVRIKGAVCLFVYKHLLAAIFAANFGMSFSHFRVLIQHKDCWLYLWDMSAAFKKGFTDWNAYKTHLVEEEIRRQEREKDEKILSSYPWQIEWDLKSRLAALNVAEESTEKTAFYIGRECYRLESKLTFCVPMSRALVDELRLIATAEGVELYILPEILLQIEPYRETIAYQPRPGKSEVILKCTDSQVYWLESEWPGKWPFRVSHLPEQDLQEWAYDTLHGADERLRAWGASLCRFTPENRVKFACVSNTLSSPHAQFISVDQLWSEMQDEAMHGCGQWAELYETRLAARVIKALRRFSEDERAMFRRLLASHGYKVDDMTPWEADRRVQENMLAIAVECYGCE